MVHAQNDRSSLGPIETCYSGPEGAVLHAKTTGEVFDPQKLVILVLKSPFCMHKATGEAWDPYRLSPKVAVLHTQNHRSCQGPIETSNSSGRHGALF